MGRTKVAIIGSGNIGTDLIFKVMRLSTSLEVGGHLPFRQQRGELVPDRFDDR